MLTMPSKQNRVLDYADDTGGDGVDASFHTKEWLDARFSAAAVKRETFAEYRQRRDKEDAEEQAQAQKLEDAEGARMYH